VIRGKSIHKSVIDYASKSMRDQERKKLMDLAAILNFAANSDQRSAFDVLSGLLERLLLEEYFKAGAKTREDDAWKSKIESVKQFVRMSRGHNSVADFLEFIDRISFARGQDVPTEKRIRITTIHKAKGAQWAHVFIPDCDADQYPTPQSQNLEEDRRLLYVAITRSSETLHLMWTAPSPSPFLSVIGFEDILLDVDKFELFTRDRAAYDAHSSTVHSIARRLPLLSFIQKEWWEKSGRSRDIKKSILQALESSPRDSSTTSLNETYDNGNPIAAPSSEDSEEKRDSIASQVEKEVEGSIDLKSDISQTILCSKCGVQLEYILSTNLSGRAWTYSASFNCFLEAHGLSREQRRNLFCRGCHTPTLLPELATG